MTGHKGRTTTDTPLMYATICHVCAMTDQGEERAKVKERIEELCEILHRDGNANKRAYWTSDHVNTLSVWAYPGGTTKIASVQIRRDFRGDKRIGDVIFAKRWRDDPVFNVLDEAYDQGAWAETARAARNSLCSRKGLAKVSCGYCVSSGAGSACPRFPSCTSTNSAHPFEVSVVR